MKGIVRNPVLVVVFSVITCGIYYLYWLYAAANDIKNYTNDPNINPGLDLILCIFCFPYVIYWMYKYGKLEMEVQMRAGVYNPTDNSVIYLILAIFGFGIVAAAIMQSGLNKAWEI